MAFPLWLGLNCLTHMLVSPSLWWMDGCQHDSVTHSPSCILLCLDVYNLFLLLLHSAFNHLAVCVTHYFSHYVCVFLGFSQCLPFLIASHCFLYFSLVAFFLSSVQSIVCQSNMWQVVRRKGNSEERKKAHWQKLLPPSSLVATKKIHQLPPWLNDVSTTLRMLPLFRWMVQLGST